MDGRQWGVASLPLAVSVVGAAAIAQREVEHAVGTELELCRTGAEAWAAQTGHSVKVVSTPNSSSERLALYQQLLSAQADDIDVFQIDVIWPGLLAGHFIDLRPQMSEVVDDHYPAMIANNTVDGRLVAMPWFASVGVLYYRLDLLQKHGESVPGTWDELATTAARLQAAERAAGNDSLWGYVWQGRAYEGLTCNALEWIASEGGGTIVDPDGEVTVDNPEARRAIARAASWVDAISPPGVLNYAEEEARGLFQAGNAVFMRNWPYAWALAQGPDSPIRGKVGVAPLPGGERHDGVSTLGGWQLAVSRYSKHPAVAADLVRFLTSAEEQKRRAIRGSLNPTHPAPSFSTKSANSTPILMNSSARCSVKDRSTWASFSSTPGVPLSSSNSKSPSEPATVADSRWDQAPLRPECAPLTSYVPNEP